MTKPLKIMLALVCAITLFGLTLAQAADQKQRVPLTAIDVLLDPDRTMITKATVANARLREHYSGGFALDAAHSPHITVLQRFVRTTDLEKVYAAVAKVVDPLDPATLELTASGYYYIPFKSLGLAGITVTPTAALLDLQK